MTNLLTIIQQLLDIDPEVIGTLGAAAFLFVATLLVIVTGIFFF